MRRCRRGRSRSAATSWPPHSEDPNRRDAMRRPPLDPQRGRRLVAHRAARQRRLARVRAPRHRSDRSRPGRGPARRRLRPAARRRRRAAPADGHDQRLQRGAAARGVRAPALRPRLGRDDARARRPPAGVVLPRRVHVGRLVLAFHGARGAAARPGRGRAPAERRARREDRPLRPRSASCRAPAPTSSSSIRTDSRSEARPSSRTCSPPGCDTSSSTACPRCATGSSRAHEPARCCGVRRTVDAHGRDERVAQRALVRRRRPRRLHPPRLAARRGHLAKRALRPARRRDLQLVVGARQLQPALPLARRGGEARRAPGGRPAARVPDDRPRREPHEADRDALPEPDVDGRRGVDPRVSARRRRPARRLRQDRARAADGRRQRRRAGDHGRRRPVRAGVVPRAVSSARAPTSGTTPTSSAPAG